MDFRVKYKNNRYKYSGGQWYFLSGENGWYISEVKEQGVIDNLNSSLVKLINPVMNRDLITQMW